jgi:hypothetical protein
LNAGEGCDLGEAAARVDDFLERDSAESLSLPPLPVAEGEHVSVPRASMQCGVLYKGLAPGLWPPVDVSAPVESPVTSASIE